MYIFKFLLLYLLFLINTQAKILQNYESQSNILFVKDKIKKENTNIDLRINFNNAVLYLEQEQYLKAINIFKKTAIKLKVPSFLNIGIAYYKLNSSNNAYLYLKKLYDLKLLPLKDLYSYVSASYYLYQITNDRKYLISLLKAVKKTKREDINEHVKLLVANTYIITKKYQKAIDLLEQLKDFNNLKLALLYIKTKNYTKSEIYFQKAFNNTKDENKINEILWFEVYMGLKTNNIAKIKENIDKIDERLDLFKLFPKMPIKIYFNKNKYTSKEYFNKILKFDKNRQIDMLFYFAPYIFSDYKQIKDESTFAFILKNKQSIKSLDLMVSYNERFSKIVKKDPIIRAYELQKLIDSKTNIKAYEYYNLAIAYSQIFSYKKAYKYFYSAYKLDKANKLYNILTLVSAKKAEITIHKKRKILMLKNLLNDNGTYNYLSKNIYKMIFDNEYKLDEKTLSIEVKNTTFYRSLKFLENINENNISSNSLLIQKDSKDPLVFLYASLVRNDDESNYEYISRLQDYIPKHYNDYFLKGPLIITEYYIDILKALGIFNKVNFQIKANNSPTYLRTKALINLYDGYAISSIKTLEKLQSMYNLDDKNTFSLLIASYLSANDYSNASATLGMLQFELKDKDAKFLNAVQLLQNLKLKAAKQSFVSKYKGRYIDIKLEGFDEFLENL